MTDTPYMTFEQLKAALGFDDSPEVADVDSSTVTQVDDSTENTADNTETNWVTLSNHGFGGIYIGSVDGKEVWNLAFSAEEQIERVKCRNSAYLAAATACKTRGVDVTFWEEARKANPRRFLRKLLFEVADRSGMLVDYYEKLSGETDEYNAKEFLCDNDSWIVTVPIRRLLVQVYFGLMAGVWGIRIIFPSTDRKTVTAEWSSDVEGWTLHGNPEWLIPIEHDYNVAIEYLKNLSMRRETRHIAEGWDAVVFADRPA